MIENKNNTPKKKQDTFMKLREKIKVKDISDLKGKIKFLDDYDYKKMRSI